MSLEMRRPRARDIVPIAVMAALGTVGRIAFAAISLREANHGHRDYRRCGVRSASGVFNRCGMCARVKLLFRSGAWTPWQMLAWGLCGLMAGVFKNGGLIRGTKSLALYGLIAAFFFGLMMNSWHIIGFVNPITLGAVLAALSAGWCLMCPTLFQRRDFAVDRWRVDTQTRTHQN
jgi:energy-coupling factor transport system substrate-specific component